MTLDSVITRLDAIATEKYPMITELDVQALRIAIKKLEQEPTTKNDLGVDCVPRIEVIDYLCKHCPDDGECFKACDEIKHLRQMPSVTPQEPKTGHWIERHDDWGNGIITDKRYKCSVCHGKHIDPETGEWHEVFDYKYPFCPNCGAKMEEVEE